LEYAGLEHRCRRIGVVLQQLCRTVAAVTQVEAAIEAGFGFLPAARNPVPEPHRNCKAPHQPLVRDNSRYQFAGHFLQLGRRCFEILFDFLEREGIVGPLVPITPPVKGMEADLFGARAPIPTLFAGDAPHQPPDV
jgi:hypothetical protein